MSEDSDFYDEVFDLRRIEKISLIEIESEPSPVANRVDGSD
ncbi:hypothetical protein [Tenacibaculum finnmarkense]|nr:hypothetical protein [Tenacibaculum finnmarkense]